MQRFFMRLFFSLYCFQKAYGTIIWSFFTPFSKIISRFLKTSPWMQKRLNIQGRTWEQAQKEGLSAAYESLFNERYGWNIIFASVGVEAIFTIMIVNLFMLPQLLITTPYFVWCMDHYTIYCVLFFCGIGYLIGKLFIFRNERYIFFFKEYTNDTNYIRWRWHFISIAFIFLLIVLFVLLTQYVFSKESLGQI